MGTAWFDRFKALGAGLLLGVLFALAQATPAFSLLDRAQLWAFVMSGPIFGTAVGVTEYHPIIHWGWLGLLLAPAHPLLLTPIGLGPWFFAGALSVAMAVA